MRQLVLRLWQDDDGALITIEFLFIASILILGLIVGLVTLRNAVTSELVVLSDAILALNQSYSYGGLTGCCASVSGAALTVTPPVQVPVPTCVAPPLSTVAISPCGGVGP
jgi:Flp pilus assembly pilin Flp